MDIDVEIKYNRLHNVYYFYMTGMDIVILGDGPMWKYRKNFDV